MKHTAVQLSLNRHLGTFEVIVRPALLCTMECCRSLKFPKSLESSPSSSRDWDKQTSSSSPLLTLRQVGFIRRTWLSSSCQECWRPMQGLSRCRRRRRRHLFWKCHLLLLYRLGPEECFSHHTRQHRWRWYRWHRWHQWYRWYYVTSVTSGTSVTSVTSVSSLTSATSVASVTLMTPITSVTSVNVTDVTDVTT